jgi:drug/metabolite transporter (DMT)-like permease
LLLGETLKKTQLLFLGFAFIGVYVLITAKKNDVIQVGNTTDGTLETEKAGNDDIFN